MSQIDLLTEKILDSFAGGGGASTGIEHATGRPVDWAINHDPDAILQHRTNHPWTEHFQASVWDVDPMEVTKGQPVGLAWFSPDCKHFSKAKGAALVDRKIRGLAWIVLRWAGTVRPRVIMLENVEEFQTWGPVRKGKPVKKKAGQTFHRFISQLENLGYTVEYRELVAADYGAPTTRKRFVLVARCDGKPIVWPERTHAPRDSDEVKTGKCKPWRSAAEIIDWSIPGYSVFASKQEIKERFGASAIRPLAKNTMRRVIRGVDKFTIKSASPFIVECNHSGDGHTRSVNEPVNTVTGKYTGGVCNPIVAPFIAQQKFQNPAQDITKPLSTVTAVGAHEVVAPLMAPYTFSNTGGSVGASASDPVHTIRSAGGQVLASANLMSIGQTGGGDRIRDIREPAPTTVSKQEACMVAANLIQYHTEQSEKVRGQGMGDPIMTVDSANRYGLASAQLVEYYGNGNPLDITQPMHTVTAHDREALVMAHVSEFRNASIGRDPREPAGTITSHDHEGVVSAHVQKFFGGVVGAEAKEPLPTVTSVDHNALCAAHMVKFKAQELGTSPAEPLPTITAQSAAGGFAQCRAVLVKANNRENLGHWPKIRALLNEHCGYNMADDEVILLIINGLAYFIADITLRMLTPRELYNATGFPPDYIIDRDYMGKPYKKSKQVARCGNAVCPPLAEAMVRANLPEWCGKKFHTMAEWEDSVAS